MSLRLRARGLREGLGLLLLLLLLLGGGVTILIVAGGTPRSVPPICAPAVAGTFTASIL